MTAGAQPGSLFRQADYVRLWTAETVSAVGTQITQLAVPILAATTLSATPFEFGLISTMSYLPYVLVSLPAGVWVDRLRRRPILIASNLGRAIALVSIPIAFALGHLTMIQLYIVGFLNGCLTVLFDLAYRSYLPSIVDRSRLVEGNSALEVSRSAAEVAGPGLAGALIGLLRAPFAILLDALSFLVSAAAVWAIRRPEPEPPSRRLEDGTRPSVLRDAIEGLRYVVGHRWLRSMALTAWLSNFATNVMWAILVLFLVRERGFTSELIGLALSIGSIGAVVAASVNTRFVRRFGIGRTLVLAAIGFSLARLPIAIAPEPLLFGALALSVFLGGGSYVAWNVNNLSLRQAIAPAGIQGRLTASLRFIVWSSIPLGSFTGAILAGSIGLEGTIWLGAIGALFAFLPVARSTVREIVDMPAPPDD